MERLVLAYAGGFDVAAAIAALKADCGQVITVTMDLGQGQTLEELRDRAISAGALRAHVLDLRDTFASGYVLPSLKAGAVDDAGAPLAACLARMLVADKLVEIASMEQAGAVAHGAGSTADDTMLDAAIAAAAPNLTVVPVGLAGRADEPRLRVGVNLWGRTIPLGAPDATAPESAFRLTKPVGATAAEPAVVEVRFERGAPVSVNGVPMPLVELIGTLTHLAGAHGLGRVRTRGAIVEAPAAVVLHRALGEMLARSGGADPDVRRQYVDMIAAGRWATPDRTALDQVVDKRQERVNGSIRVQLFRGELQFVD